MNQTPPPFYGNQSYSPKGYSGTTQVNAVMKRVYVRMFLALLVSAFCALGVVSSPAAISFFFGNKLIFWGCAIAMLVMAWVLPSRAMRMSSGAVLTCFFVFAALMGVWIAPIFFAYSLGSIVSTFFICAGTFGAMSVYGYFTKANLNKFGTYLFMGLIGLIIASVVNIFLHSSTLGWVVSIAGVLIFVGLTAWDTQTVKQMALANPDPAVADRLATIGALNLYLDFINLFLYLLRIFGGNRD